MSQALRALERDLSKFSGGVVALIEHTRLCCKLRTSTFGNFAVCCTWQACSIEGFNDNLLIETETSTAPVFWQPLSVI